MRILSDLCTIVTSLTDVIVTTATKTNIIVDNVLSVGEIASNEWKADAVFDATKASTQRASDLVDFEKSLLDME
jgi:hypothetical protein